MSENFEDIEFLDEDKADEKEAGDADSDVFSEDDVIVIADDVGTYPEGEYSLVLMIAWFVCCCDSDTDLFVRLRGSYKVTRTACYVCYGIKYYLVTKYQLLID